MPGEAQQAGRELKPDEMMQLMQACEKDRSPAGVRDGAIIALLYAAGLRRAELVDDSALRVEKRNAGRSVRCDLQDDSLSPAAVHQRHAGDPFLVVADEETPPIPCGLGLRQRESNDVIL